MKNSTDLRQQLLQNMATRKPVALEGLHKSKQFSKSYSFQPKASIHNGKTICCNPVLLCHRKADNKIQNNPTDRMLSEKNAGRLDDGQPLL